MSTDTGRPMHTARVEQPWSNGRAFVACACPLQIAPNTWHEAGLVLFPGAGDDDD